MKPKAEAALGPGPWVRTFFVYFPPITSQVSAWKDCVPTGVTLAVQMVFAAPIPAMKQFRKAGSTGDVSPVPYGADSPLFAHPDPNCDPNSGYGVQRYLVVSLWNVRL